ncbi:hypothetical protein D9619_004966 [Psilocybe cf. subviscida]|uniref:Uncharacterized protein n=1 Tax=Psilocybe cf. subviscida TaxID=2480587 RepID=A0A8H5BQQ3_9AGAR|nr:hypothetical protein D9619_004966 [Psilocybe cf. subviscida]
MYAIAWTSTSLPYIASAAAVDLHHVRREVKGSVRGNWCRRLLALLLQMSGVDKSSINDEGSSKAPQILLLRPLWVRGGDNIVASRTAKDAWWNARKAKVVWNYEDDHPALLCHASRRPSRFIQVLVLVLVSILCKSKLTRAAVFIIPRIHLGRNAIRTLSTNSQRPSHFVAPSISNSTFASRLLSCRSSRLRAPYAASLLSPDIPAATAAVRYLRIQVSAPAPLASLDLASIHGSCGVARKCIQRENVAIALGAVAENTYVSRWLRASPSDSRARQKTLDLDNPPPMLLETMSIYSYPLTMDLCNHPDYFYRHGQFVSHIWDLLSKRIPCQISGTARRLSTTTSTS